MTEIVDQLRAAMHAAVDGEEALPGLVVSAVVRRHRMHAVRVVSAATVLVLAMALSVVLGLRGPLSSSSPVTGRAGPAPTKLIGLPMPAGTSISLLIGTSTGAAWYSTATGQTEPIAGLPASPGGYQFGRLTGGMWAVAFRGHGSCKTRRYECVGAPQEYYFIADGSLTASPLGNGNLQSAPVPGHQAGTVWLTNYPNPGANPAVTAASLQLVSTNGQPVANPIRLPVGYALYGAIGSVLLIGSYNDEPTLLWDPVTRSVLRRLSANVIDAGPDQVAWAADCGTCKLRMLNLATGVTLSIPVLNSTSAGPNEAFSQDGRLLAVQLSNGAVGVVDTMSGKLTVVRGSALGRVDFEYLDWQGGSHRLIIRAGPNATAGPDQIAYWQPGDSRVVVTTIRDPAELSKIETGSVG